MDFDLSEEQKMLATAARDFFTREYPPALARQMAADARGYPPELWQKMADMGWQGLALPEEYGGMGGSFLDLAVLLEEMGRARLLGPFFSTVVLGGLTVLEAGSPEQKASLLPGICSGDTIITLAFLEADGLYQSGSIETKARRDGSGYILDGTKLFVENAHVADYIITPALTDGGISLFLVAATSPGIRITPLHTGTGSKQSEAVYSGVRVPAGGVIGDVGRGWQYVESALRRAAVARCAEMVGGAKRAMEMTAAYAKERVQFDRPIGSFQAIQQEFASMVIEVETSAFITYQAAWMLSEGLPCVEEAATAKSWVSEACRRALVRAHQIHGTIGFTEDHDLPLYYRQAKEGEVSYGDADFHRHIVAGEFLDRG